MSDTSTFARFMASLKGGDDPLAAENGRLAAELDALKTASESFESTLSGAVKSATADAATIASLTESLAAAEEKVTAAESRAVAAEANAVSAKAEAVKAKADAKAQIEAAEKGIDDRAAKMAMDQMAAAGFDPGSLPKSNGAAPEKRDDAPKYTGPRSEADAIRHAASHWRNN